MSWNNLETHKVGKILPTFFSFYVTNFEEKMKRSFIKRLKGGIATTLNLKIILYS